ncbi:hypothetical protein BU26DRAFT_566628 [Trematosphaeria pertusa]|uniref:NAD(P)-binding protein n=1 Tax=Trematosphaeria pertusa TaxID=390896 RepID=A0A6A6IBQ1_9PLEO|nr:uncharacterized protein BU26DRAFT_566628 [Trematosphaeria pertusa]KAF2247679.1 hypothetical protein BU26DRAFT_566628 [Trematosphaeria pertusa]
MAIFDQAFADFSTVDVVINAAGVMNVDGMIEQIEPAQWWNDHEVNVKGTYNLAHHFTTATNGTGTFINLVSLGASFLAPDLSSYSTAKPAAIKLGEDLDLDNQLSLCQMPNLRTFSIHPGIDEAAAGRGAVIDHIAPFAKGKQPLPAVFTMYLQKQEVDFLRGGFVSENWDIEEGKPVKLGFVGAKFRPEGHPWKY